MNKGPMHKKVCALGDGEGQWRGIRCLETIAGFYLFF